MTFDEFERHFLAAALLTSQELASPTVTLNDMFARFELPKDPRWIRILTEILHKNGATEIPLQSGEQMSQQVRLSPAGIETAQQIIDGRGIPRSSASNRFGEGRFGERPRSPAVAVDDLTSLTTSEEPIIVARDPAAISSEAWTGIARVRVEARNAKAISSLITSALDALGKDDNANVAQARTLLLAARDLTDAPDPPSDLIWELIQRSGTVVGLLDLFVRIFSGLSA